MTLVYWYLCLIRVSVFVFSSSVGVVLPMFVRLVVVVSVCLFTSPIFPLDILLLIILMFENLVVAISVFLLFVIVFLYNAVVYS